MNFRAPFQSAAAAASLLLASCAATPVAGPAASEYGIADKGSDLGCDPSVHQFCWTTSQTDALRDVRRRLTASILLEEGQKGELLNVVAEARELGDKLGPDGLAQLDTAEDILQGVTADAPRSTYQRAARWIHEATAAAQRDATLAKVMAQVRVDEEDVDSSGLIDDKDETNPLDSVRLAPRRTTGAARVNPGAHAFVERLKGRDLLGLAYATLIEQTGVIDRDYDEYNARFFGECNENPDGTCTVVPKNISREERVRRIIHEAKWLAAYWGFGSGALTAIPFVGVGASVSTELVALFDIRATMVFQIAAVHGWDVGLEDQFQRALGLVFGADLLWLSGDLLITNTILPVVAQRLAVRYGITLPQQVLKNQATVLINRVFRQIGETAAQEVGERTLSTVLKGVLSIAITGVVMVASAFADYITTQWLGEQVHIVAKQWMRDLMTEGTTWIAAPERRGCFFNSLMAMGMRDGELSPRERRLFEAFMSKTFGRYSVDGVEQSRFELTKVEKRDVACSAREAIAAYESTANDPTACLGPEYNNAHPNHRLVTLAYLYAMANVDLRYTDDERTLYESLRRILGGEQSPVIDSSSPSDEINREQLIFAERAVLASIRPQAVLDEVDPELATLLGPIDLTPEDLLGYLREGGLPVEGTPAEQEAIRAKNIQLDESRSEMSLGFIRSVQDPGLCSAEARRL